MSSRSTRPAATPGRAARANVLLPSRPNWKKPASPAPSACGVASTSRPAAASWPRRPRIDRQNRMSAFDDADLRVVAELWCAEIQCRGALGKGGEYVEFGDGGGDALQLRDERREPAGQP